MRVDIDSNGNKFYYNDNNDKLHREDGPAIEYPDGYKAWLINGNSHREDGPAVEYADGRKFWYLDGNEYTEQEFDKIILKYKWNKFVKDHQCV